MNEQPSLSDFFSTLIFATGTPANYQRILSEQNKENICECSVKEAIEEGFVKKPTLNLAKGNWESELVPIILSVLKNENDICENEVFSPRILVCFDSIEDINSFHDVPFIQKMIGVDFHIITIHSPKPVKTNNIKKHLKCFIDFKEVTAKTAFEMIEKLDANEAFEDDLPVIVCQVDMIGEGINVRSFNSVITCSTTEKMVMQQVGRAMRNYSLEGYSETKINDGHCSLYVMFDNYVDVAKLLNNLGKYYHLTEDCFEWGKKITSFTGKSPKPGEDDATEYCPTEWTNIDPDTDIDILQIRTELDKIKCLHSKDVKNNIGIMLNYEKPEVEKVISELQKDANEFSIWKTLLKKYKSIEKFLYETIMNAYDQKNNSPTKADVYQVSKEKFWQCMTRGSKLLGKFIHSHITKPVEESFDA